MASLRDIRRKISSVKKTQQITRAMQMVSAAKLQRAQDRLLTSRPYSNKLAEVIGDLVVEAGAQIIRCGRERMTPPLGVFAAPAVEIRAFAPCAKPGVVVAHAAAKRARDAVGFRKIGAAVLRGPDHDEHLGRPAVITGEIHEVLWRLGCVHFTSLAHRMRRRLWLTGGADTCMSPGGSTSRPAPAYHHPAGTPAAACFA